MRGTGHRPRGAAAVCLAYLADALQRLELILALVVLVRQAVGLFAFCVRLGGRGVAVRLCACVRVCVCVCVRARARMACVGIMYVYGVSLCVNCVLCVLCVWVFETFTGGQSGEPPRKTDKVEKGEMTARSRAKQAGKEGR